MQSIIKANRGRSRKKRVVRVRARVSHRLHYWVVAQHESKEVLLGPFPDRERANAEGYLTNAYFEVFEWPTRDRARATQIYKEVRLQKTQDLGKSLERISHTLNTEERRL